MSVAAEKNQSPAVRHHRRAGFGRRVSTWQRIRGRGGAGGGTVTQLTVNAIAVRFFAASPSRSGDARYHNGSKRSDIETSNHSLFQGLGDEQAKE